MRNLESIREDLEKAAIRFAMTGEVEPLRVVSQELLETLEAAARVGEACWMVTLRDTETSVPIDLEEAA